MIDSTPPRRLRQNVAYPARRESGRPCRRWRSHRGRDLGPSFIGRRLLLSRAALRWATRSWLRADPAAPPLAQPVVRPSAPRGPPRSGTGTGRPRAGPRPSASRSRRCTWTSSSEWPPRSKKLSCSPTCSIASTSLPDRGDAPLQRRLRGAAQVGSAPARRRPGAGRARAVELAVRRQRQRVDRRRAPPGPCSPAACAQMVPQRARFRRLARRRDDVADQPQSAGAVPPRQTTASRTPGCAARTASISPSSIRKPRILPGGRCGRGTRCRRRRRRSAQVAGAVQAAARIVAEGVGDEALRRQLRPVEIAARDTRRRRRRSRPTTPDRDRLRRTDRGCACPDRAAARRSGCPALQVGGRQRAVGDVDRGLRDPVHVDQPAARVAVAVEPRAQGCGSSASPPKMTRRSARSCRVPASSSAAHELPERRRRLVEHRDALARQQVVELVRRAADRVRHDHQPSAVQQRAPDLPDREVEGEGVEQRPHVPPVEAEPAPRVAANSRATLRWVTATPLGRPVEPEV